MATLHHIVTVHCCSLSRRSRCIASCTAYVRCLALNFFFSGKIRLHVCGGTHDHKKRYFPSSPSGLAASARFLQVPRKRLVTRIRVRTWLPMHKGLFGSWGSEVRNCSGQDHLSNLYTLLSTRIYSCPEPP